MSKRVADRVARLQRMLNETREVRVVLADFAQPRKDARPPSPPEAPAPTKPALEPTVDLEPRCERCGARARLVRGEVTCLACMIPGDPRC